MSDLKVKNTLTNVINFVPIVNSKNVYCINPSITAKVRRHVLTPFSNGKKQWKNHHLYSQIFEKETPLSEDEM